MNRAIRIVGIVLIVTLICPLFSGCATTRRGQEQAKGATLGAVIGAVVGGSLGALTGRKEGVLAGAAIGAVLGGGIGFAVASRQYDNIEKASNKAQLLDNAMGQNSRYIEEQTKELAQMEKTSKELDKQTAALASEYADRKITAEALATEKTKVDKEVADSRLQLEAHQKELAYLQESALPATQKYGTQEQIQRLESQISIVQEQNSKMEKAIEETASYSQRLVAG